MQKTFIILALVFVVSACGQRIAPKGPENKVIDSHSY